MRSKVTDLQNCEELGSDCIVAVLLFTTAAKFRPLEVGVR